jgi:hypothetical protein
MNPDEFKARLEQFAELKQMRVPKTAAVREADEPETVYRGGEEFTVDLDDNPTIGWGIKKLKPHIAVCEDCCQVVENRVVEIKVYDSPELHWRRHCKNCKFSQNPYTKEYDLTIKRSHYVNNCYITGKPEPLDCEEEEKSSHLKPVFKKPTK